VRMRAQDEAGMMPARGHAHRRQQADLAPTFSSSGFDNPENRLHLPRLPPNRGRRPARSRLTAPGAIVTLSA